MAGPPSAIADAAAGLSVWLVEKAYPLWWEAGADLERGGFHDRLEWSRRPAPLRKRLRVAARQVYSYAQAPRFGWRGPWRTAMDHGLAFLERAHRRPDGLYRTHPAAPGKPDGEADLYDQAFVLLALCQAFALGERPAQARALGLLAALPRAKGGGFAELSGEERLANPNMHLFEALLAWSAAGGGEPWPSLARAQARLALRRLIDPATGAIAERFGAGWRSAPDEDIWPGHQFEWAWLLLRQGDPRAVAGALRLVEIGERAGVDRARGVAIDALDAGLNARDAGARLWPQTERLKANLAAAEVTGDARAWSAAEAAANALRRYLDDSGLWRDRLDARGAFVDEPAPASSLYHIVGAALELQRVCAGR